MGNQMRGNVDIEIGGKVRHLRLDMNALVEVEESINIPISDLGKRMSFKTVRAILFQGLRHEDSSLTIEQIGAMIDMGNLNYSIERIGLALGSGESRDEKKNVKFSWKKAREMAFGVLALKPDEFWKMTIPEFADMCEGYEKRHEVEMEMLAWHAANVIRPHSKRPITVNMLLGRTEMSMEEAFCELSRRRKLLKEKPHVAHR